MTSILQFLVMLTATTFYSENYVPVCDRDINNLSLSTKVELSIGCSRINNRQAYRESKLLKIYESDAIFLTK